MGFCHKICVIYCLKRTPTFLHCESFLRIQVSYSYSVRLVPHLLSKGWYNDTPLVAVKFGILTPRCKVVLSFIMKFAVDIDFLIINPRSLGFSMACNICQALVFHNIEFFSHLIYVKKHDKETKVIV